MIRTLALLLVMTSSAGCGLLIDGAYLLGDGRTHKEVEQRRPTDQSESKTELRLVMEQRRLRVACEEVTRGVDRVWTVTKTYQYQGGLYQAHWLPVLLEGIIGTALAIGIGKACNDPGSQTSCNLLYGTIPFGVDVLYSLIRLAMIDPPKLIDKRSTQPHTEPHAEATTRSEVACNSATSLQAFAPSASYSSVTITTDAQGFISPQDQQQLTAFLMAHADSTLTFGSPYASSQQQRGLARCPVLEAIDMGGVCQQASSKR